MSEALTREQKLEEYRKNAMLKKGKEDIKPSTPKNVKLNNSTKKAPTASIEGTPKQIMSRDPYTTPRHSSNTPYLFKEKERAPNTSLLNSIHPNISKNAVKGNTTINQAVSITTSRKVLNEIMPNKRGAREPLKLTHNLTAPSPAPSVFTEVKEKLEINPKDLLNSNNNNNTIDRRKIVQIKETELLQWQYANLMVRKAFSIQKKEAEKQLFIVFESIERKKKILLEEEILYQEIKMKRLFCEHLLSLCKSADGASFKISSFKNQYQNLIDQLSNILDVIKIDNYVINIPSLIKEWKKTNNTLDSIVSFIKQSDEKLVCLSNNIQSLTNTLHQEKDKLVECNLLLEKVTFLENKERSLRIHRIQKLQE